MKKKRETYSDMMTRLERERQAVDVRKTYLGESKHSHLNFDSVDIEKDIMLLDAGCGYGKTTLMLNWEENDETVQIYKEVNKKRVAAGLKPTTRGRTLITTSRAAIYEQMVGDINERLFDGKLSDIAIKGLVRADLHSNAAVSNDKVAAVNSFEFKQSGVSIDDIPQITTNAALANSLKRGVFPDDSFDMLVADEAHSMILDITFADTNYYLLRWLESTNYTKLFMTATPEIWTKYIKKDRLVGGKFNFKVINAHLPAKYQADKVSVKVGIKAITVLEYYKKTNKLDEQNKCLAFLNSATSAIKNMVDDESGSTMALISEHNDNEMKLSEKQLSNIMGWKLGSVADELNRDNIVSQWEKGKRYPYVSLMNINNSRKKKLIEEGKIDVGINAVLATSAYREGISISEDNLAYVISEYTDIANLIQATNRNRRDNLREIIVVINNNFRHQHKTVKDDMEQFLSQYEQTDDREKFTVMEDRYELQGELINGKTPRARIVVRVEEVKGFRKEIRYEINEYLYAYFAYMEWHYAVAKELALTDEEKQERADAEKGGAEIAYTQEYESGEQIPSWKEFYSALLSEYSREGKVEFDEYEQVEAMRAINREVGRIESNENIIVKVGVVIQPFLNVVLGAEEKKQLVEVLNDSGLRRAQGKAFAWTSARRAIEQAGFEVKDKRVDGKRCVVIVG